MSCKSFMTLGCIAFLTAWSKPGLYLGFEGDNAGFSRVGRIEGLSGPIAPEYPGFPKTNRALEFDGSSRLVVKDPGERSPLDFANGDFITMEAWGSPGPIGEGENVYLIGKGRTNNKSFAANNQNYALRLRGQGGASKRPPVVDDDELWIGSALGGSLNHQGAYGVSNELAEKSIENPVSLPDFHATIHATLGIDPSRELNAGDRPVPITDGGVPIAKLFN